MLHNTSSSRISLSSSEHRILIVSPRVVAGRRVDHHGPSVPGKWIAAARHQERQIRGLCVFAIITSVTRCFFRFGAFDCWFLSSPKLDGPLYELYSGASEEYAPALSAAFLHKV
jgi:hypothetical protein